MNEPQPTATLPLAAGFAEFLRRIPKTDLHFHLLGAVRPRTVIELAIKHAVELPTYDPVNLYRSTDFEQSLEVLRLLGRCVLDVEDFAQIMYEALEDAAARGNGRHIEASFNPTVHTAQGVSYPEMLEGLTDGIVRAVVDHPSRYAAGIGMDFSEGKGFPGTFEPAYRLAGEAGLKRTAHVCESNQPLSLAPPWNARTCIVDLQCDRLDHGYNILADNDIVALARDKGIHFCTCPPTAVPAFRARRAWTIAAMRKAGLKITLNTDDPWLYGTDLADAWVRLFEITGWGVDEAREFMLNGIDACWAVEPLKQSMRQSFTRDFDALRAELLG